MGGQDAKQYLKILFWIAHPTRCIIQKRWQLYTQFKKKILHYLGGTCTFLRESPRIAYYYLPSRSTYVVYPRLVGAARTIYFERFSRVSAIAGKACIFRENNCVKASNRSTPLESALSEIQLTSFAALMAFQHQAKSIRIQFPE